jgi:outer membrane usher protein
MRRLHRAASGICAALLWCLMATAQADDAGSVDPNWHESVLELRVNGVVAGDDFIVLRDAAGALWLTGADFTRLRLRQPHVAGYAFQGRTFYPLAAIPGAQVSFDEPHSTASISAPAAAFQSTNVTFTGSGTGEPRPPLMRSGSGAFLNYQLYGQTGQYTGADVASAYGELGIFSPAGVLTNTATETATQGTHTFVRLESTFTHDFASSLETLRLGDAISVGGSWGTAVRFGGVQWGSNYGIRPDLVTTPLLAASGAAVLPSTVEVFVNGRVVGTSQVPAGPFVVNQVPALTGAGEVSVVVKNALGQEQVVTVPFYSAAVMLQPGLSLYDVDVGALRQNFGLESNDYGPALASATFRHGFTAYTTGEVHAEALKDGPWAAGLNLAQALDHWAVVTADVAAGGQPETTVYPGGAPQPASSGTYGALGIQHIDERLSVLLQAQHASAGFRQVGDVGGQPLPRDRDLAHLGWSMGHAGSLQVAFVTQTNYDGTHQQAVALTYQVNMGPGSFSANVSRTSGDTHDSTAFVFYTLPLGGRRTATTSVRYDSQLPEPKAAFVASLQKSLPLGRGDGYLLSAGTDGSYNAEYLRQTDSLTLDAGAARFADQSAQRVILSGGLLYMGGDLRAARTVTDSFALVDLGGIPNVTVYFDNQPVARTDDSGIAVVRDLRSFDVNRISVDPLQLPLDAALGEPQAQIVPPYRSGTLVHFPVKRVRSGVFKLRRADGSAVPAGAVVKFQGEEFPVGYDGLTYVTNYDHGTTGEATWTGGECAFRLPPPPAGEVQPDLGVISCRSAR